ERGEVGLWDSQTEEARPQRGKHAGPVEALALSPDGKVLASGSKAGGVKLWVVGPQGLTFREDLSHPAAVHALNWSSDGGTLAAGGDGTVHFWHLKPRQALAPAALHKGPVRDLAFSPDDKL